MTPEEFEAEVTRRIEDVVRITGVRPDRDEIRAALADGLRRRGDHPPIPVDYTPVVPSTGCGDCPGVP